MCRSSNMRRPSLFRLEVYDIIHSVGDYLMASNGSRSGRIARWHGTERIIVFQVLCVVWSPSHVALLLNVTYRFLYRRVTKNEPSSVLKILRRARHTNRGSLLFPVSCLTRVLIFWKGIPGTFYAPAICSRRSGNNQFALCYVEVTTL